MLFEDRDKDTMASAKEVIISFRTDEKTREREKGRDTLDGFSETF